MLSSGLILLSVANLLVLTSGSPTFFKKGKDRGPKCLVFYDHQVRIKQSVVYEAQCTTTYKNVCQNVKTTELRAKPVNECKTVTREHCSISYESGTGQQCKTAYKQSCTDATSSRLEKKCSTTYEQVCPPPSGYGSYGGYGSAPKCEQKPKQNCFDVKVPVKVQSCRSVPTKECADVQTKVPKKTCKQIPNQQCHTVLKQVPQAVNKSVCSNVPTQQCSKVPRTVNNKVPITVPRKVCERPGYSH